MKGVLAPLTKLVIFAVTTALATGLLAFTISNTDFAPRSTYLARFTDATGLVEGDDVRISGVKVGSVESIKVVERRLAEVGFTVEQGRRLPASVQASLRFRNLVGQRYLALEQGAGPIGALLPPGGVIPVQRTRPALNLTVLFNGFKPLFQALDPAQVNQLSYEIIQVLQGEGGTVESLLASTASLTATIADRDQVIGAVVDNLNVVLDTINAREAQLSRLIVDLQRLVSGLAADREPIGNAIASLAELTDVTAGLVGEVRPPLRADILALDDVSRTLADSEPVVQDFLRTLPGKLESISRTATYGSWFNFYLCAGSGTITLPPLPPPLPQLSQVPITAYHNTAARCGR